MCLELAKTTYHPAEGARAMKNDITAKVEHQIKMDWMAEVGLDNGGTVTLRAPSDEEAASGMEPYELVYSGDGISGGGRFDSSQN